jgi:hypothetical protein
MKPSTSTYNALRPGNIVVVHGLVSRPQHNLQAAIVLERDDVTEGRVPVQALHGISSNLAVKRSNLLNMNREADQTTLLTMITWKQFSP